MANASRALVCARGESDEETTTASPRLMSASATLDSKELVWFTTLRNRCKERS